MTQAACHFILHYSTARLSWKTIKSLRRSRSRLHNNNKQTLSSKDADRISNHVSQEVEFEILQGWTILALHSLIFSTGLEYTIRFIIPFYYHLKMLMLIAFTVPLSWATIMRSRRNDENDNDNSYGLSPLIPFCFNNIIVPGVHRAHELMDNDPRGWILYAIAVMPLLILDYVFLPGVLMTEEERKTVRNARLVAAKKTKRNSTPPPPPTNTPPRRAFPSPISKKATTSKEPLTSVPELPRENVTEQNITSYNIQSKAEKSYNEPRYDSNAKTSCPKTPPRRKYESEDSSSSCSPTPKGFSFTQTPLSPFLNKGKKNLSNLSGFSPLAKSRITSSALRLRQFSRDHNVLSSMKKPSSSKLKENDQSQQHGDESLTLPNIRRRKNVSDDIFASSGPTPTKSEPMDIDLSDIENDNDEPTQKVQRYNNKRRERQRLSFGDHFREMVTGDASIRVRDHLFDLELPSVPSPSPRRRRGGNISGGGSSGSSNKSNKKGLALSPNVTTRRRSSRLAKRKGSHETTVSE
jgi:hypothetical protein